MNDNQLPSPADDNEKNPLEFFAIYLPGVNGEKYYLGNGKEGKEKGVRLFKTYKGAHDFLIAEVEAGRMRRSFYDKLVIHPVEGLLAMPGELDAPAPAKKKPILKIPDGFTAPTHLYPIHTLASRLGAPSALELLQKYQRNNPKGKKIT